MKNIYAVLVAYNPEPGEVQKSILNLLKQCSKVVLCNNSSMPLPNVKETGNVKIFNFKRNLGIASAQSIGMTWAFEDGADFVLQMDQDSLLPSTMVSSLISRYEELTTLGYKVGIIGPRHYDKITNTVDVSRLPKGRKVSGLNCEVVKETISSACLISSELFCQIGKMDDDLFIDLVDWEYCWRAKKHGYLTVRDNDLLLPHRVGNGITKLYGSIGARTPSPVRHYYHSRNVILMIPRGYVPLGFKVKNLFKLLIKLVVYPYKFSDGKVRFHYILKGILDGLKGKKGEINLQHHL
ncbi:glycosyltransferase family 2 protein [Vibrio metschnikovii]|uniref:glycosyltransferase family 2 protein n=1 Tax=Vibrio metschnikovii TaxID=28172 RepID=UPI003316B5B7